MWQQGKGSRSGRAKILIQVVSHYLHATPISIRHLNNGNHDCIKPDRVRARRRQANNGHQVELLTRASYSHHYRLIVPEVLAALSFQVSELVGVQGLRFPTRRRAHVSVRRPLRSRRFTLTVLREKSI